MIDVKSLFQKIKITDAILIASYYYAYPSEDFVFDDVQYDNLKSQLPKFHPYNFLNWDTLLNTSEVEDLLKELNLPLTRDNKVPTSDVVSSPDSTVALRAQFNEAKSMQMVQDMQSVYNDYLPELIDLTYKAQRPLELVFSYKMDGWNISSYYKRGCNLDNNGNETVYLAHSRGRSSDTVSECTELFRNMLPPISFNNSEIECFSLRGELCLKRTGLNILKENYPDKALMNVRNSVSALVHQTIDVNKYNKNVATYFAFSFMLPNTENCFNTVIDMYTYLQNLGLDVPYYKLMTVPYNSDKEIFRQDVIRTFETYFNHMEENYLQNVSLEYEADGCVIQPNDLNFSANMSNIATGNFGSGLLAVKAGKVWGKKIYKSKVTSIYFSKARVNKAVMCTIEPVKSNLGTIISRVELDNLRNAVLVHNVQVGDTIEFTLHSQQIIQILRNVSAIERSGVIE